MQAALVEFLVYLMQVLQTTAWQIFLLFGPGLVLALGMYYLSGLLRTQVTHVFNWKIFVYLTAPGTILHELGHAAFCLLFGHEIREIRLFDPDPSTGSLGYVTHAYRRDSLYQVIGNFFIGIGPLLVGSTAISLAATLLVGPLLVAPLQEMSLDATTFTSLSNAGVYFESVLGGSLAMLATLFQGDNLGGWEFYLFMYLVFAIGSHTWLSPPDLESAWSGFAAFLVLLLSFNLVTLWMGNLATELILFVSKAYSFFYGYMLFVIILTLGFVLLFAVLGAIKRLVEH